MLQEMENELEDLRVSERYKNSEGLNVNKVIDLLNSPLDAFSSVA